MYKAFFKLQSNPFSGSPDPRFLYMMPHLGEALARLEYGIAARKGVLVLTGEVGTGKTTLLRHCLASLDKSRVFTSFVFNPRLDTLDFLEFVLSDFGIAPAVRTKAGMLIQLNRWLVDRFANDEICVIVIDEAQNLSVELLEEVRLLTNLETSSEKLVQIVLCGQPELEAKLRQSNMRQLRQRISLWGRTQPLTEEQTAAYIAQRLLVAGTTEALFSLGAIAAIFHASQGIPRIINLLCEHALILGYVEQTQRIPSGMIDAVALELDLGAEPSVAGSSESISGVEHAGGRTEPAVPMGGASLPMTMSREPGRQGR